MTKKTQRDLSVNLAICSVASVRLWSIGVEEVQTRRPHAIELAVSAETE